MISHIISSNAHLRWSVDLPMNFLQFLPCLLMFYDQSARELVSAFSTRDKMFPQSIRREASHMLVFKQPKDSSLLATPLRVFLSIMNDG